MQRFYLNLRRGEIAAASDDEGAEFASIEEAYLESFKGAQELWAELLRHRQDPRQYAYDITDKDGVVLMELPFAEIVESCRRVGPASRSEPPKSEFPKARSTAFNQRAYLDALENARELNRKSAELWGQLRAAQQSISEIKSRTQAISHGVGSI